MTAITALKFNTESGVENALDMVQNLAKQQLIILQDAALVTWTAGKEKPETQQLTNLAGIGTLDDAFWGMFFGLIFSTPLSDTNADILADSFTTVGIDDDFFGSVRKKVTEGTSALFLVTGDGVLDRISEVMQDVDFELVSSGLSREQDAELKAAFIQE